LTIFDLENPDIAEQHKKICDFNKNYQLLAEAKFVLFKFFSIIHYSDINLDELSFELKENEDLNHDINDYVSQDLTKKPNSVEWNGNKIKFE
jgi:hypothetical protein